MAATGDSSRDKTTHPGHTLQRRFMDPNGLGVNQLARALGVPPNRISAILAGQRSITADTALRLARLFDTTALYWMNLQARHDLTVAEQVIGAEIAATIPPLAEVLARSAAGDDPGDRVAEAPSFRPGPAAGSR